MKKIVLTALAMMFITSSVYAASMGVSATALYYDASGTETVKSSGTKNEKSDSGLAPIPSFFIETETADGGVIGLDVIPFGANVADASNSRTDTDTDDASDTAGTNEVDVNFKNHITLYMEKPVDMVDGAFVKFGLNRVTIETDETLATGSTYGDETVLGVTIGIGKRTDTGDGGFTKIEANVSRYQGATFQGSADSDSVRNSIELDPFYTAGIRLSVGKASNLIR